MDSAGLRQTNCPVETEGVRRALAAAQQAHVVVHLSDASSSNSSTAAAATDSADDQQRHQQQQQAGGPLQLPLASHAAQLWVHNKVDLLQPAAAEAAGAEGEEAPAAATAAATRVGEEQQQQVAAAAAGPQPQQPPPPPLLISCKSGQGIEQLLAALRQHVAALVARDGDDGAAGALVTRARHRSAPLLVAGLLLWCAWSGGTQFVALWFCSAYWRSIACHPTLATLLCCLPLLQAPPRRGSCCHAAV